MTNTEIEKIKEEARAEGRAQEAKAQAKTGCAWLLFEFAVGAIIGGIVGNAVAGGDGVLWGVLIGGMTGVFGIWWLFV